MKNKIFCMAALLLCVGQVLSISFKKPKFISTLESGAKSVANKVQEVAHDVEGEAKKELGKAALAIIDKEYTSCMIDPSSMELVDQLRSLKQLLDPNQTYVLLLNNGSSSKTISNQDLWRQLTQIVEEVLGDRIYRHTPGEAWPTMKELKGKIIIFLDEKNTASIPSPILSANDYIFETDYSYEEGATDLRYLPKSQADQYLCSIDRGKDNYAAAQAGAKDKLFLVHHYMTQGIAGKESLAEVINTKVGNRVGKCKEFIRFWPTIVQVDFVEHGDVKRQIDALNQEILKEKGVASLDDLRFNEMIHLVTHNGTSNKPAGYFDGSHKDEIPAGYSNYVDKLGLAKLKKLPGFKKDWLIDLGVNDQGVNLSKQIQLGVTGFKIPLRSDPARGDKAGSSRVTIWSCHGLEKSDLESKIKQSFGVK